METKRGKLWNLRLKGPNVSYWETVQGQSNDIVNVTQCNHVRINHERESLVAIICFKSLPSSEIMYQFQYFAVYTGTIIVIITIALYLPINTII